MAMLIPCPECGTHLAEGVLKPCPNCGWTAPSHDEAVMKHLAEQLGATFGRVHGSRIRAWIIAIFSLVLNLILATALLILILSRIAS